MQARANAFVNDVKKNENVWRLCCERFSMSPYPEVKFWCLQTLHEVMTVLLLSQPGERGRRRHGGLMAAAMRAHALRGLSPPSSGSLYAAQVLKASYSMFPDQARAEVSSSAKAPRSYACSTALPTVSPSSPPCIPSLSLSGQGRDVHLADPGLR
jgi:hypothetical protein